MPRVLIGPATLAGVGGPYLEILRHAGCEVIYPPKAAQMTEPELRAALPGIDAVLAGSEPYTRAVFAAHRQLQCVARNGVGYDAVDLAAATEFGVPVTVSPANADAVAEHTFALLLALAKNVVAQHRAMLEGGWPRGASWAVRGQTLGLIGLGRIGQAVARRAVAFGMTVVAYEPYPNAAFVQQHGIELLSVDEVVTRGDYVSLHMPLTAETRQLIDRRRLNLMKPTAFLINTARGHVVDESALTEALAAKRIAGAGLDVFEEEPPGVTPLIQLPNVVVTAHTAGTDFQSRDDMAALAAETIVRVLRGEWPDGLVVNPEVRGRWQTIHGASA